MMTPRFQRDSLILHVVVEREPREYNNKENQQNQQTTIGFVVAFSSCILFKLEHLIKYIIVHRPERLQKQQS